MTDDWFDIKQMCTKGYNSNRSEKTSFILCALMAFSLVTISHSISLHKFNLNAIRLSF